MNDPGNEPRGELPFLCPHCQGPLHLVDHGDVECLVEHRYTLEEVIREQSEATSRALWRAASSLQERAVAQRWTAGDPDLYGIGDPDELERQAAADEETATELRQQAQAIDRALSRLD